MQLSDKVTEYLDTVCRQIRWQKAQAPVLTEIQNHLNDQKDALLRDGLDEETAISRAIEEMGDPVVVGEQLDRAHRPRPDWPLLALTAVLLLAGLTIQFLIGGDIHIGMDMFSRQIIWAGLAIIVLLVAYFLDFTIIGKYSWLMYWLIIAVIAGGYWLDSGDGGFIPHILENPRLYIPYILENRGVALTAVYPLLLFPTAFAGIVYTVRNKSYGGLIRCEAAAVVPAFLASMIHNSAVFFLICVSGLIVLTYAITKGWFKVRKLHALLVLYGSSALVLSIMLAVLLGRAYIRQRLQIAFDPSLAPTDLGYRGLLIQQFLGHSRLIGEGLPLSGYGPYSASQILPAANTDFILTYLTYKFGWILIIGIILVFAAFIVRSFIVCKRQKSVLGQLVSLAIILTFALQCFTFIIFNFGFLLFAPVSLPLISYGGRSLLTNMCLIGFLLSTFRTGSLVRDRNIDVAVTKSERFIQYYDGKILINLKGHTLN